MKLVQRKKGVGPWYVRFTGPDGKDVRISTEETDKQIARIKGLEKMREYLLDQGTVTVKEEVNRRSSMNLAWALEKQWRDKWSLDRSKDQFVHVVRLLQKEVGHWPIEATTYTRLKDYAQALRKEGKANSTINRRMSAISTALRECVRDGKLPTMPQIPRFSENNTKERYLSPGEEAMVLALLQQWEADAAKEDRDVWSYMGHAVVFLLDTGLRLGELVKTRDEHRMEFNGRVKLNLPWGTTKSGKGRGVPLTKRADAALQAILANPLHPTYRTNLKGYAVNGDGERLKPSELDGIDQNWLIRRWAKVRAAVPGLKDVTLHILRHTCASRLVQRGVNLYAVKDWLGHSSITTTERYAHLAPEALSTAVLVLEPADEPLRKGAQLRVVK